MDFLKTLLLYMTVTMAAAVQNGPLPEDVPTPTVAPAVQVQEAAETPDIPGIQVAMPDAPTPTPAPTEVPEPTITPNRAYKNIAFGDRGNDVRKLQERLIELGYMPEGAADGSFGYQTYGAVRDFQGANGLYRDGVAGPATQTRLFEDPNVVAVVTPTPAVTETPEPMDTPEPEAEPAGDEAETSAPAESEENAEDLRLEDVRSDAPTGAEDEEPAAEEALADENAAEEPERNSLGLTLVTDASIVLGESGSHLVALRLSDGVMVPFYPRVWLGEDGEAVISLRDMADSIGAWTLEIEENTYTLSAVGYVVTFTVTDEGLTCKVDGEEAILTGETMLSDGEDIYVTESFLRQVFRAGTVWDADEKTLMLDIPEKEQAQAND